MTDINSTIKLLDASRHLSFKVEYMGHFYHQLEFMIKLFLVIWAIVQVTKNKTLYAGTRRSHIKTFRMSSYIH